MNYFKLPPVLDSQSVLLDHIKAKLTQYVPVLSVIDDLAKEICESRSHAEITKLLGDDKLLREALFYLKTEGTTKQILGAELFNCVSRFETALCAQVTGMLLDLDIITICQLLCDLDALENAVLKAKEEFINYKKKSSKEYFGEDIFRQVLVQYSDTELAGRLTGMLLELDVFVLQRLLDDPQELQNRLKTAYAVIASEQVNFQGNMASKKHKDLAAFIKGVHQNLRLLSRAVGEDQAWLQHCQNIHVLEKYAESMQLLATEFWEKRNHEDSKLCRIQWVVEQSVEYFYNKGCEEAVAKEEKLSKKYLEGFIEQLVASFTKSNCKLKLLDVGSCYNPFYKFPMFDVTAIDLNPATCDVLKCDFLSVNIVSDANVFTDPCVSLPANYFDIVVFSLLLEYFPSSKQRFKCCENAYNILKPNGVLYILTPDSKHATANSKVMKSWRYALASLGFWRVSYSKLRHLHCMSYRRAIDARVPQQWLASQTCQNTTAPQDWLYIPQDLHQYSEELCYDELSDDRCDTDNKLLADIFSNFPDNDVFL